MRQELKEATEIITPVLEERRRDLEAARTPISHQIAMMMLCSGWRNVPKVGPISLRKRKWPSHWLPSIRRQTCSRRSSSTFVAMRMLSSASQGGCGAHPGSRKKTALHKAQTYGQCAEGKSTFEADQHRFNEMSRARGRRIVRWHTHPKGSSIFVSSHKKWDPAVCPNPGTFDPYRILRQTT